MLAITLFRFGFGTVPVPIGMLVRVSRTATWLRPGRAVKTYPPREVIGVGGLVNLAIGIPAVLLIVRWTVTPANPSVTLCGTVTVNWLGPFKTRPVPGTGPPALGPTIWKRTWRLAAVLPK